MGWISKRFMRSRAKWGATVSEEKRKAPLRRIVRIVRSRSSLFDSDTVEFECGHVGEAYGDVRGRCVICFTEARPDLVEPKGGS